LNWNITAGPAFQQAWFESAEFGGPTERSTGALTFGSRFECDITHRIELILEYRGQYTSKEVGETTHHSVSTLSLELNKRFDLDVAFTWDRIANPKVGADGVQPKPDDFRQVVGSSSPCRLVGPYKLRLNLTDLPCSHGNLRQHAGGTNPGSITGHSPLRILGLRLPL